MSAIPFYPDAVPIVFSANDYYVPYMAAMIQSIMENAHLEKQYAVYILFCDIEGGNMELLQRQVLLFLNFRIEFIDVTEMINKNALFVSRHVTVETYFRLLIPELFFQYEKVIYLDGDMICCTDIAELMEINLENYLLAAARDTFIFWHYGKKKTAQERKNKAVALQLTNPEEYFCAGMCVFNISAFRKTISQDKLFELAASRKWYTHDQDVLNFLADGKVLLLPFHWDYFPDYRQGSENLPQPLKDEYNDAVINPKIIHYKPWKHVIYVKHAELFWKYATRTPFIDTITSRMEEAMPSITTDGNLGKAIITNIQKRQGIGIKFILFDCLKAWLLRDKKRT